ncbi:Dimeric alpha-beta barrel [Pyrenophora seminiperda CCB06]|uniref:Dimeric alpha-beta barrel n=1 Tax=Pyrenophora seminiperda CCB06 TaxID=1302712 RepID=A0A3M7M4P3_9PLEO|nr:Dimeric alpha-beta barrel [Pyrenophora seminiperda CCB06]
MHPEPNSCQPPPARPTMSPLTGPGISLTFSKDAPNMLLSSPYSRAATQYKAANPSYNKQHLIVRPIDDVAIMKQENEIPDQQDNVRIYKQVQIYSKEKSDAISAPNTPEPAPTLLLALMQPAPSGAADLDAWYRVEHNEQMSKEPGWLRTCRYEVVSHSSDDAEAKMAFLALHGFGEGEVLGDTVQVLQPVSEWTKKVMRDAVGMDAAIYRVV